MIPSVEFPEGNLKLLEMDGKTVLKVHAEFPSTQRYRDKIQRMRNDLLMTDPTLDLQIRENNS